MRRPIRLVALLPVVALVVVAGCAPAHAGAAATVGDDRITTSSLRDLTASILGAQPADGSTKNAAQTVVQDQTLAELIALQVLDKMASQSGATVNTVQLGTVRTDLVSEILTASQTTTQTAQTPAQQDQAATGLAAAAGVDLGTLSRVRAMVVAVTADLPVTDAQIEAAYAAETSHLVYQFRTVSSSSQATATAAATALKAEPTAIDTVAAGLGTAATAVTTVPAPTLASELQTTATYHAGSVIGPVQTAATTYTVLVITAVSTQTLADADATNSSERQTLQLAAFPAAYKAKAASLGVHVNPRFGVWMPTATDLLQEPLGGVSAAAGSELSSSTASPSASASASASTG